jgi:hypothetical protein
MPNVGEIVKAVRTEFRVDVHQVDSATKKVEGAFSRLSRASTVLDQRMTRAFRFLTSPVAGFVGAAGAGMLVKGLVSAGRAAEDSELQITSLLLSAQKASGIMVGGFGDAAGAAKKLREEFKQLAIESPVGFEDIQTSFGLMVTPLSRAGLDLAAQAKFARDVAVRGKLEGRDNATVGNDVAQILSGIGGHRQITTFALKSVSEEAAKLAKSGKLAEAAEMIRQALMMTPEELKAFEGSFTGMLSTLQDRFITLREKAAKPLMDFMLKKMGEWAKWLAENQDRAEGIAKTIGNKVASAVRKVTMLVEWMAEKWGTITTAVETLAVVWIGAKLFNAMSGIVRLGAQFAASMEAAKLAAATTGVGVGGGKGGKAGSWVGVGLSGLGVAGALLGTYLTAQGAADALEASGNDDIRNWRGRDAGSFMSPAAARAAHRALSGAASRDLSQIDGGTAGAAHGGGGTRKVRKLVVERAEFRERDFSRFSAPQLAGTSRRNIVGRPIAGLGLGQAMVGR